MTTQTYCIKSDLEAILSPSTVLRLADDDETGTLSNDQEGYITAAIERAAGKMNSFLDTRYQLSDLASNQWCQDANAVIAIAYLAERRSNDIPASILREFNQYLSDLGDIQAGRMKIPQQLESVETIPTVTNFATDLRAKRNKVKRVDLTSTGSVPPSGRKSHPLAE